MNKQVIGLILLNVALIMLFACTQTQEVAKVAVTKSETFTEQDTLESGKDPLMATIDAVNTKNSLLPTASKTITATEDAMLATINAVGTELALATATLTPRSTSTPTVAVISKENVERLQLSQELFKREEFDSFLDFGFLPDGKTYWISGIIEGAAVIRLYETSQMVQGGERDSIYLPGFFDISPDGTQVATYHDGMIDFLSIPTGELIDTINVSSYDWLWRMKWSPDGRFLAIYGFTQGEYVLQVYLAEENQLVLEHKDEPFFLELIWSPTGEQIAAISSADVLLWNVKTGTLFKTLEGHSNRVDTISWSPDGEWLASTSNHKNYDGLDYIWHGPTGGRAQVLHNKDGIYSEIVWSPDSTKYAYVAEPGWVYINKTIGGAAIKLLKDFDGYVQEISWSPDGKKFIVITHLGATVYSIDNWDQNIVLTGLINQIRGHSWAPDTSGIIFMNYDQMQYYDFNLNTTKMLIDPELKFVRQFALHPEDEMLAFGTADGVSVYSPSTGWYRPPTEWYPPASIYSMPITSLEWMPGGNSLIFTQNSAPMVYTWDVHTGDYGEYETTDVFSFIGYGWTPDRENLITVTAWDGTVLLWDFEEMKIVRQIGSVKYNGEIMISDDGKTLYSYDSNDDIHVWNLETFNREEYIHLYELDDQGQGTGRQLVKMPDGSLLSLVRKYYPDDDIFKLAIYRWNDSEVGLTHELIYKIVANSFVLPVAFSSDRTLFVTDDGRIYETATGELLVELPTFGIPAWTSDGKYLLFVGTSVEYWSVDGR